MRQPLVIDEQKLESLSNKSQEKKLTAGNVSSNENKAINSKIISSSSKKWKVPEFKEGFDLDKAKDLAFKVAGEYMNEVLNYDDLNIEIELEDEKIVGNVKDMNTGKLVSSYNGVDLLKVYSQNRKERGIIVDGRV